MSTLRGIFSLGKIIIAAGIDSLNTVEEFYFFLE